MAKQDIKNEKRATIDHAHKPANKPNLSLVQQGHNTSYQMGTSLRRAIQHLRHDNQRVLFDTKNSVTRFHCKSIAAMITYDSGADGPYISEEYIKRARIPMIRKPNKQVRVANGGIRKGQYVTKLPFQDIL